MGKAAFSADDQLEFDFVSEYKIVRTKVSRWNYLLCLTCGFFYLFVYSGHPEQKLYYTLRPDLHLCPYCRCVISAVDELSTILPLNFIIPIIPIMVLTLQKWCWNLNALMMNQDLEFYMAFLKPIFSHFLFRYWMKKTVESGYILQTQSAMF